MNSRPHITAVILVGGKELRVEGAEVHPSRCADHATLTGTLAALRPQVAEVLISADGDPDPYRGYGCAVVSDDEGASHGPLSGALAALQRTRGDYLLTVPCDGSYLPEDYAERMLHAALEADAAAAVAHDGERMQPVYCLLAPALIDPLRSFLDRGQRRARIFLLEQDAAQADFSDCASMFAHPGPLDGVELAENGGEAP